MSVTEDIECGLSWTPGGRLGNGPEGPVVGKLLSPLGVIDSHYFLRRLFLGGNTLQRAGHFQGASWSESSDTTLQPSRSVLLLRPNSTPSKEPILASGLRKQSDPPMFDGNEDEARKEHRPIRPSPLANRSNSRVILSDSDSSSSQAPVIKPDPAKISILNGKIVRSQGPVHGLMYASDLIDPWVMRGNHARSQSPQWTPEDKGSNLHDKMRNLSGVYNSPTPSVRCVSECTQLEAEAAKKNLARTKASTGMAAAAASARRHASTGNALPWRKEDPLTRLDKRHENFTDPDDDELVNAIMRQWQRKR